MGKMVIDRKDDKFLVSIIPYLENTFVLDEIEISEDALNVINKRKNGESSVKKFVEQWGKIFQE